MQPHWYIYIIETDSGSLYTGISRDTQRRFQEHLAMHAGEKGAKGAKYFRMHEPQKIIFQQVCASRSAAIQREREIKKMSRQEKLYLCYGSNIHQCISSIDKI